MKPQKIHQIKAKKTDSGYEFEILATFDSVKDIAKKFRKNRSGFDQALRSSCQCQGFFWIEELKWDKGERPDTNRQIRYTEIYAYDVRDNYKFKGRFENAVKCSEDLKISVSNIRLVAKGEQGKETHKGYYFSYFPLNPGEEDYEYGIIKEDQ